MTNPYKLFTHTWSYLKACSLDRIDMTEKRLEYGWKNFTSEHNQKFTTTNINLWTWPKNILFFVGNFLVMFTNFGHIHSVILNRSSEHSSFSPLRHFAFLFFRIFSFITQSWKWQLKKNFKFSSQFWKLVLVFLFIK